MTQKRKPNGKISGYFVGRLWDENTKAMPAPRRFGIWLLQVGTVVFRGFSRDNCLLRASALTYATLLSIVPLLAFAFAILKGLGVQNQLEPLIMENLAVGSEAVVSKIFQYIDNTSVARLGTFGLMMLLVSVLALLSNIERSFNHIWHVGETRSLIRRFSDYFSVLAFGPLMIVAAISMTATLETMTIIQGLEGTQLVGSFIAFSFKVLPYIAMWIAFTFLLLFMPNTRVKLRPALIGGIFGGTLWQLSQLGYVGLQVGVARYNAIYGTMAALPVFMVWLYISWIIVLLGVEVSYAAQNLEHIGREIRNKRTFLHQSDFGAMAVLLATVRLFCRGDEPIDRYEIADRLDLSEMQVREFIDQLIKAHLLVLVERDDGEQGYQPARSPDRMFVAEVLRELRGELPTGQDDDGMIDWQLIGGLSETMTRAEAMELQQLSLQDLAKRMVD
ncbi:MAG: ribonuclease BN-like protein [Desulfuromonas sp.]|nr:MAG: ribonuclease BN-like protein [Desulfuromonas sp.]